MGIIKINGDNIRITNPEKVLWPKFNIRKIDYISKLIELAPYIIPHSNNRLLTTIRYPDGINKKSFYQKSIPNYAPEWIDSLEWKGNSYITINKTEILAWLGNQAALEFHTAFNLYNEKDYPNNLVFDLDPSKEQIFDQVVEVALIINNTLKQLDIKSYVKTSGATGLQVYIPIGGKYTYEIARKLNQFFANYFHQKYPELISIERTIDKRKKKLYFDYLQMWYGKTIINVYSPRATEDATVSMPVEWSELERGIKPEDFTLLNSIKRLSKKGDIFKPITQQKFIQDLDYILQSIES